MGSGLYLDRRSNSEMQLKERWELGYCIVENKVVARVCIQWSCSMDMVCVYL